MAQIVKLKRTSVSGKIPSISNLQLGELAINTYDGRVFLEKDNGTPSIQEFLTTNTEHPITGSITLNGDISATNITLSGNLTVEGTTTTIDSTTVNIGDNILELNYGGTSTTSGLLVKDATGGSTTSGSLLWDATNDYWKLGKLGSESPVITVSNLITNLPSGTVSGSSQITITESQISDLDHYTDADVKSKLDTELVLSGSNIDGITVSGSFSGSFQGDGTNLTGLTVDQVATVSDTFTNTTSKVVTHNFGTKNVIVNVYDNNDGYFIPSSIVTTNDNQVTITFSSNESGRVVVAKGGHVVSGSASDANQLNGEAGSYYLDYGNFTNIPSGIISSSAQIVSSLSNQDVDFGTGDVTATTGSFDVIDLDRLSLTSTQTTVPPLQLTANSLQDGVGALRIDGSQADIFLNPSTATHTTVTFAVNNDQRLAFGMDNNSDFYITRRTGGTWYDDTLVLDRDTGKVTLGYDLTVNGNINATNGIVSGSSQITDLTTYKETVSGASSYAVDHNLNEQYPIVQAWNTGTSQQELPTSITTNSVNRVTVVFSTNFAGVIIVKK